MPSGGYRKPPARTPPGGPGRFSRRTDGAEIPRTPGLNSDLQYGQVGELEAAAKAVPPKGGARGVAPAARAERSPTGAPASAGSLPAFLTQMEPEYTEPTTTGLDVGPGAGREALMNPSPPADIRELVLERIYLMYANNDAYEMLQQLREERAQPTPAAGPTLAGTTFEERPVEEQQPMTPAKQ